MHTNELEIKYLKLLALGSLIVRSVLVILNFYWSTLKIPYVAFCIGYKGTDCYC